MTTSGKMLHTAFCMVVKDIHEKMYTFIYKYITFTFMHLADALKRLTVHSGYIFILSIYIGPTVNLK